MKTKKDDALTACDSQGVKDRLAEWILQDRHRRSQEKTLSEMVRELEQDVEDLHDLRCVLGMGCDCPLCREEETNE